MPNLTTGSRLALTAALLLAGCDNAGTGLAFPVEKAGIVQVAAYLDRDGSRTLTAADTTFAGARVALLAHGSDDTVKSALTGANGVVRFTNVPLGEYRIVVAGASLGDTVQVAAIDTAANIKLTATVDSARALIRLGYPELTLRQARALPSGKRVFVRAIILSGVQAFRDTTSHVSDSSSAMRMTRVVLRGGLTGSTPGDSVTVLAVTSTRVGQPTLDQAIVSKFGARPAPIAIIIGTGVAGTASGGLLDASLVQIIGGVISDTLTITPDFKVVVSDGTGSLSILLDANQLFVRSNFKIGKQVNAKGVLVPDGAGGWYLKPRDPNDAVVF